MTACWFMWKYWLQSMAVESAIRKIRKIKVFKKWKLQSMDCNQDYYHSQYRSWPDYDGNMDTMNYRNNYDWYICSVGGPILSILFQQREKRKKTNNGRNGTEGRIGSMGVHVHISLHVCHKNYQKVSYSFLSRSYLFDLFQRDSISICQYNWT